MSQKNVEVLRRSFEAWNRNYWETLMACHAPDVIAVPPAEWPEAETGRSRDTLRHQFERTKAPWEEGRAPERGRGELDRRLALAAQRRLYSSGANAWKKVGKVPRIPSPTRMTSTHTAVRQA